MSKTFKKDLTGMRFGRLTVLVFVPTESPHSYWLCMCDCGNKIIARGTHLQENHTVSCGCLSIQKHYRHGECQSRIYKIWESMKNRCYNPNNKSYKRYGKRGIKICEEWRDDFAAFRNWALKNGYDERLSIDRIDVNGNYEPSNCRWSNSKEQSRNRRNNVVVEYFGKQVSIAEAAELAELNPTTVYMRYHRGDRGERLFRPVKKSKK